MSKDPGAAEPTTLASDLRRLFILGLLTALAVLVCERLSEGAVGTPSSRVVHVVPSVG